jgi:hypothetical protein
VPGISQTDCRLVTNPGSLDSSADHWHLNQRNNLMVTLADGASGSTSWGDWREEITVGVPYLVFASPLEDPI